MHHVVGVETLWTCVMCDHYKFNRLLLVSPSYGIEWMVVST